MKSKFTYFIICICLYSICLCACSNDNFNSISSTEAAAVQTDDTTATGTNAERATEAVVFPETDYSSIDNTIQNWGQGVQFDTLNRPLSAIEFQEKYLKLSAIFIRNESEDKTITLTFDEGYENGYTSKILDILKEHQVHAVFFVTLPYVKENPDLIKRMIEEGHLVGNHSSSHPANGMPSLSTKEQQEDIMKLHEYVKDNFNGYSMNLFRFPAGKFSQRSLVILKDLGYQSMFWSFAYADWNPDNQPEESSALKKLTERLHPGAVYLLHAVSKTNADILGQFIEQATSAGYQFIS